MKIMPEDLRKLDAMHQLFGKADGKQCGDCPHICKNVYDRTYYKCECYGVSNSVATDWAKRWMACGLIDGDQDLMCQIRERDGSVVNYLKHQRSPKALEECEGQISMEF